MSVRREVVSLSQLLRRNETSNSRRGTGRAPPLPLQISRRRAETPLSAGHRSVGGRQTNLTPFTERPASARYQPLNFTQGMLDANRASTSQPEAGASSQTSGGFPALSQEVYEAESEQLSAMTSMSQSSFSQTQTQSQNLLASSQDDQLHRLQQWQAQQAPPPASPSPVRCNDSGKLQKLEQNLTKAFFEQTREQKRQQQQLMARFASPIKKSVQEIKAKLVTSGEDQQQQKAAIGELAEGISNVTATATELRLQSLSNKAVCEETRTAVINEAAAVKAALTRLQARIKSVESSVKSCSGLVAQVLEGNGTKHETLLSAVAASSCNCPQEVTPAEDSSCAERATRKRKRSPRRPDAAERNPSRYTPSSINGSPARTRARSPVCYDDHGRAWRDEDEDEVHDGGLHLALQRIEALRAKRHNYQHGR